MSVDMAQVYTDFSGLAALRAQARDDREAALDAVARQFESLFLQMMLKSMRDASLGEGLMDGRQGEMYRDMFDKQITLDLAQKQGIGLADVLKRQLGGDASAGARAGLVAGDYRARPVAPRPAAIAADPPAATGDGGRVSPAELDGTPVTFLDRLWPAARDAAARLQLAPEALLAQAALETGWGRHVIQHGGGDSSHNLFGIKADARWSGDSVRVSTLEYRDGVALKTRADFRAYGSFEESFADYVDFLQRNPRYREALARTSDPQAYFRSLQEAGYATDPAYADKIQRILDSEPVRQARRAAAADVTTI